MEFDRTVYFSPFSSVIEAGFWQKVTKLKVDVIGLNDAPLPLRATYSNSDPQHEQVFLNVEYNSLELVLDLPPRTYSLFGWVENLNTIEEFKGIDKQSLLNKYGLKILDSIKSGSIFDDPHCLSAFIIVTYLDVKKYQYYYWCGFPAIKTGADSQLCGPPTLLSEEIPSESLLSFTRAYGEFITHQAPFFLVLKSEGRLTPSPLRKDIGVDDIQYFAFADPSSHQYPSWLLRNYLYFIKYHWLQGSDKQIIKVLCVRDYTSGGARNIGNSKVLNIDVSLLELDGVTFVGWEKNERNKFGPRRVDLRGGMDPYKLAENALDLNLKLMRWRIVPELDLEYIASFKCLLLGAGTLGCNVARMLLAWGVKHITLIDNGTVSYSNPPRQSLFTFQDSQEGGNKAECASNSLKKIYPGVISEGYNLMIPMPGHCIGESETNQVKKDVQLLEDLVKSHDVLFLLMDSRESRWLPSVMGIAHNKIIMNAALGFDSYLVMRYGVRTAEKLGDCRDELGKTICGSRLGCYFCTDVVAPGNSMSDRTLDQQCTVTRPGVSMMAASLVVELLISLLSHPDGGKASSEIMGCDEDQSPGLLGSVPHTIRGYLSKFQQYTPAFQSFPNCTACSEKVIDAYKNEGFKFLIQAFNTPEYLETLTGLKELLNSADSVQVVSCSDSEESDD